MMIHRMISNYLARTEARIVKRTMSDAALIGWTLFIGIVFVAPAVAILSWVVALPPIPGLS